jgi:anti-sigma regulatory factor (Ser/Thr protein kinase)
MKEHLAQMRVGGLGIYLMRTLMDEIDFDVKPGKRNQVKMSKYFLDKTSHHADLKEFAR